MVTTIRRKKYSLVTYKILTLENIGIVRKENENVLIGYQDIPEKQEQSPLIFI